MTVPKPFPGFPQGSPSWLPLRGHRLNPEPTALMIATEAQNQQLRAYWRRPIDAAPKPGAYRLHRHDRESAARSRFKTGLKRLLVQVDSAASIYSFARLELRITWIGSAKLFKNLGEARCLFIVSLPTE